MLILSQALDQRFASLATSCLEQGRRTAIIQAKVICTLLHLHTPYPQCEHIQVAMTYFPVPLLWGALYSRASRPIASEAGKAACNTFVTQRWKHSGLRRCEDRRPSDPHLSTKAS